MELTLCALLPAPTSTLEVAASTIQCVTFAPTIIPPYLRTSRDRCWRSRGSDSSWGSPLLWENYTKREFRKVATALAITYALPHQSLFQSRRLSLLNESVVMPMKTVASSRVMSVNLERLSCITIHSAPFIISLKLVLPRRIVSPPYSTRQIGFPQNNWLLMRRALMRGLNS